MCHRVSPCFCMLHHFGHWNGDFSVGSFCIEAAFHDKTARFLASFSSESCTRLATCIATHGASSLTSQQESGGKPVVDSGGFQLGNCERRRATKYLLVWRVLQNSHPQLLPFKDSRAPCKFSMSSFGEAIFRTWTSWTRNLTG